MPRRRCCCCIYETDRFDRVDNTDIGANWSEVLGDWEIKDEELYTEYADAAARNLVPHPDNEFNIRVTVDVKGGDDDDELDVRGPWWASNGYLFARLRLDSVCATFELYSYLDGVTTLLASSPVGPAPYDEWHEIEIAFCMHSYPYLPRVVARVTTNAGQTLRLYASFDIEAALLLVPIDGVGITGGVSTGTITLTARFDNFTVAQTKGTDENDVACPDCATSASSCLIFEDGFERDDSTDIGCFWDEAAGDWETVSNTPPFFSPHRLQCVSAGRVICLVPAPIEDGLYVQAELSGPLGTSCRILGDYIDASNYIYGEVTFDTVFPYTNGQARIVSVTGGVETELDSDAGLYVAGTYTLCLDNGLAVFGIASAAAIPVLEADYAVRGGLLTGIDADDGWAVDDYVVMRARSLPFAPNCPTCFPAGPCEGQCNDGHQPPDEITVDMTGLAGLTAAECSWCPNLPAVFILRRLRDDPCCFQYFEEDICNSGGSATACEISGQPVTSTISINACVRAAGSGVAWDLDIRMTRVQEDPFHTGVNCNFSVHGSGGGSSSECDTFPVSLTFSINWFYTGHPNPVCSGPNSTTVTIDI